MNLEKCFCFCGLEQFKYFWGCLTCISGILIYRGDWGKTWSDQCHWNDYLLLIFPERRGHTTLCRATKEAPDFVRSQKQELKESLDQSHYWPFMEKTRQGRVNGLGLARLSNFSRLWGLGAVRCCLVYGLELI